jgi:ABC-type amino acid transport substrate-binding protein
VAIIQKMLKIFILSITLLFPCLSNANIDTQQNDKPSTKLSSVEDLKDKRIGVVMGSAHEIYATKNYPNATVLQYKSPADVLLAVKTGKVDASFIRCRTTS